MLRTLSAITISAILFNSGMARAQRQPAGAEDEVKKLQEEIEKIQGAIKKAEAQLRKTQEGAPIKVELRLGEGPEAQQRKAPEEKVPAKVDMRTRERPEAFRGREGKGQGGFGGVLVVPEGKGLGGFEGGGFGGPWGGFPGPGGGMGGTDVKSLKMQLQGLQQAAKMIAARTSEVEALLKKAQLEEEASKKDEEARNAAEAMKKLESVRGRLLMQLKERGPGAPVSPPSSSDVEKRLDRIEQALQEIQKELRNRK